MTAANSTTTFTKAQRLAQGWSAEPEGLALVGGARIALLPRFALYLQIEPCPLRERLSRQGNRTMGFQDPHSYADLSQGKIEHLDLSIKADFSENVLSVRAHYTLHNPVSGSLFLDTRGLHIGRVTSQGRSLAWDLDRRDAILGERLHLKNLDRTREFAIEVRTSPEASALQWMKPGQTLGGKFPFLYSQCQSIQARSVVPCQDTPSVRFTYRAELEVPRPLTAVMAAEAVGVEQAGPSARYQFSMRQPIPSYLFALAAGELRFRTLGDRTGVYAEPEMAEAAAWEFAENETKLATAEQLLGPYLWGRYDILVLPPSFPFGGMENPRLTFLSPLVVLGDRSRTNVVSHELAHAWTGNLVTNATWEDFWLNEGWTTYAEGRITEAVSGRELSDLIKVVGLNELFEDLQRFGDNSKETCLKFPQEGMDPEEVYSQVPYIKGSMFLVALEEAVGREAFDLFIQKYISTYRFQSLSTEGFLTFLADKLPEGARRVDIHQWIYQPGYPQNAPRPSSILYDDVQIKLEAYRGGILPSPESIARWVPQQVLLFLQLLPRRIPVEDCRRLETLADLGKVKYPAIRVQFFQIAIASGYREVWPMVEQFARTVGNRWAVGRLFEAMVGEEWTRGLARPLFERYRDRNHPMTVAHVEQILKKAAL